MEYAYTLRDLKKYDWKKPITLKELTSFKKRIDREHSNKLNNDITDKLGETNDYYKLWFWTI